MWVRKSGLGAAMLLGIGHLVEGASPTFVVQFQELPMVNPRAAVASTTAFSPAALNGVEAIVQAFIAQSQQIRGFTNGTYSSEGNQQLQHVTGLDCWNLSSATTNHVQKWYNNVRQKQGDDDDFFQRAFLAKYSTSFAEWRWEKLEAALKSSCDRGSSEDLSNIYSSLINKAQEWQAAVFSDYILSDLLALQVVPWISRRYALCDQDQINKLPNHSDHHQAAISCAGFRRSIQSLSAWIDELEEVLVVKPNVISIEAGHELVPALSPDFECEPITHDKYRSIFSVTDETTNAQYVHGAHAYLLSRTAHLAGVCYDECLEGHAKSDCYFLLQFSLQQFRDHFVIAVEGLLQEQNNRRRNLLHKLRTEVQSLQNESRGTILVKDITGWEVPFDECLWNGTTSNCSNTDLEVINLVAAITREMEQDIPKRLSGNAIRDGPEKFAKGSWLSCKESSSCVGNMSDVAKCLGWQANTTHVNGISDAVLQWMHSAMRGPDDVSCDEYRWRAEFFRERLNVKNNSCPSDPIGSLSEGFAANLRDVFFGTLPLHALVRLAMDKVIVKLATLSDVARSRRQECRNLNSSTGRCQSRTEELIDALYDVDDLIADFKGYWGVEVKYWVSKVAEVDIRNCTLNMTAEYPIHFQFAGFEHLPSGRMGKVVISCYHDCRSQREMENLCNSELHRLISETNAGDIKRIRGIMSSKLDPIRHPINLWRIGISSNSSRRLRDMAEMRDEGRLPI